MSGIERRLYLIRHGKADRRSSGETVTVRGTVADPPLDATGREQASMLATRLRKMPEPAAIYCSTLARARQTIEPFVEAAGAKVTYSEDLVEWFGGAWEFKEFEELLVEHPEIPHRILLQDPVFHLAPGGEPFDAFQRRVVGAIDGALSAHPEGDLWVVCHGGVINAYLASFLELHEQDMFFLPPNTSINTVKVRDDARALWFLADDTHVTAPELFPGLTGAAGSAGKVLPATNIERMTEEMEEVDVSLRFLSPEWAEALTNTVNAGDAFAQAAGTQRARIQQVITAADGQTRYWTTIEDGTIAMGMGDLDAPDATITQSYDTAVALAKRELSPVTGFMMGKIKVDGNMGLLMGLAGALGKLADAMAGLDVQY